ncbi:hypothetical protein D3C77_184190 [compost metagenome]
MPNCHLSPPLPSGTENLVELAHLLRMRFGTSPQEPTPQQTQLISMEIRQLHRYGVPLDQAKWHEVLKKHCPSTGKWVYRGLDNSDLKSLLALALQATESRTL